MDVRRQPRVLNKGDLSVSVRRGARQRRSGRWATGLVALAASAGVLAVGVPSADAHPAAPFRSADSYRYAGYRSVSPMPSAAVTFTVPTLSCGPGNKTTAVEFGVTVLTGAAPAFASAIATCYGTQARYEGFVDVNGRSRGVTDAGPGDTMEARATVIGSRVQLRITDLTTHVHLQMDGKLAGANRGILAGVLGVKTGAVLLGVPNFHTVNFTNVSLGGKPLDPDTAVRISRTTPNARLQIQTSQPTANGSSFSARYVAS